MNLKIIILLEFIVNVISFPVGLETDDGELETRLLEEPRSSNRLAKRQKYDFFIYESPNINNGARQNFNYNNLYTPQQYHSFQENYNQATSQAAVPINRQFINSYAAKNPSQQNPESRILIRFREGSDEITQQTKQTNQQGRVQPTNIPQAPIYSYSVPNNQINAQIQSQQQNVNPNVTPGPRYLSWDKSPAVNILKTKFANEYPDQVSGRQFTTNTQSFMNMPFETVQLFTPNIQNNLIAKQFQDNSESPSLIGGTFTQPNLNQNNPFRRIDTNDGPIQVTSVYYTSSSNNYRTANNTQALSNRQIIPTPQEFFNSALNVGNNIFERFPGYQATANLVGFLGNVTRFGATAINNQLQSQFSPIRPNLLRPHSQASPTKPPINMNPLAFPIPVPYPTITGGFPIDSTLRPSPQYTPTPTATAAPTYNDPIPERQDVSASSEHQSGENQQNTAVPVEEPTVSFNKPVSADSNDKIVSSVDDTSSRTDEEDTNNAYNSEQTSGENANGSQEESGSSQDQSGQVHHEDQSKIDKHDRLEHGSHDASSQSDRNQSSQSSDSADDSGVLDEVPPEYDDDDRIDPKAVKSILG